MGGADVIPGVSGGTIAFITGIYSELLHSIKSIDFEALKLLFSFKFSAFWNKVNGSYLFAVLAGLLTSMLSLARMMIYFLEHYPIRTWSYFYGIILVTSHLIFISSRR